MVVVNPADEANPSAPEGHGLRERLAARVVLLDPDDRVLLMRYDDGPPNGVHWCTPGGGLDEGEDYPEAALRELAEETGWTDIALLGEVHRRTHTMEYLDTIVRQSERLYLARTDQRRRQIVGVEAMHAHDSIAAWRWWTLAELDSTTETIWPANLTGLIRKALASPRLGPCAPIDGLARQRRDGRSQALARAGTNGGREMRLPIRHSSFQLAVVAACAALLAGGGPARAGSGTLSGGTVHLDGTVQSGGTVGGWGKALEVPGLARLNTFGQAHIAQVSCSSPGNCAAGGYYTNRLRRHQPFVVTERAGRWGQAITISGLPALSRGPAEINSVSCASRGNCGADGSYTGRFGLPEPFVVTERAGRWGQAINVPGLATLNVGRRGAGAGSVSCPSPGNCVTGGYYTDRFRSTRGFVVAEVGGRWTHAVPVSGAEITSVSCPSAGHCTAVGNYASDRSLHTQAFIVSEN